MPHEFDGKKYEKASGHQKEWGAKLIAELDLRGNERVLDLGCGDGNLTAQIADLLLEGEIVGIDASRSMIEAAMPKSRKNLQFLLMDINELDFVDRFDIVLSNATLHWVKDHKRLPGTCRQRASSFQFRRRRQLLLFLQSCSRNDVEGRIFSLLRRF
jgi:trans-aconitate methyltransferase